LDLHQAYPLRYWSRRGADKAPHIPFLVPSIGKGAVGHSPPELVLLPSRYFSVSLEQSFSIQFTVLSRSDTFSELMGAEMLSVGAASVLMWDNFAFAASRGLIHILFHDDTIIAMPPLLWPD